LLEFNPLTFAILNLPKIIILSQNRVYIPLMVLQELNDALNLPLSSTFNVNWLFHAREDNRRYLDQLGAVFVLRVVSYLLFTCKKV